MDILVIVLISCVPLLIFIVIILLLVIITYRCRQSLEKKHKRRPPPTILHQNERLNNQSERPESSLKNGGVRVEEVPVATNPLPLHLHHSSTSSGFVDEMEHEFKYGQGDNGYSQTQSDDVDEHCFHPEGNPYAPYPIHDYPHTPITPRTPMTPHSPYAPAAAYGVEEPDAVPYSSDMRMGPEAMRIPAHLIPRSLSEEAHLARMSGISGPYDRLAEGAQYPEDYPEHIHRGHPHYLHSPPHSQPHPYPHNAHYPHHHHPHPHHHHHHYHHSHSQGAGGRDNRIMAGMENALVRAIEEVDGSRSPSLSSSMGSRTNSMRRSGRRRHHRPHHTGSGRVYGGPRVGSPVGAGPGYHGYHMAYREDEPYQSNTLPRTSSKQGSPITAHRSPPHHVTGASPLVHNVAASSSHYVRSASNELLETRRDRPYVPPLDTPRNVPGPSVPMEMPRALSDEDPMSTFQTNNPRTVSPPISASQVSEDNDYDHINSDLSQSGGAPPAPPPPPPPAPEPTSATNSTPLRPPTTSANRSSPPSSSIPPNDSMSLFPQELFKAIQKRANSIDNEAPNSTNGLTNGSSAKSPPAPPLRTVSDPKGNPPPPPVQTTPLSTVNGKGNPPPPPTRHTPVFVTSSNSKGSPPAPPIRHTPVTVTSSNSKGSPPAPPTRVGSIRGQSTNQQGAPPPPPPPPPIRH